MILQGSIICLLLLLCYLNNYNLYTPTSHNQDLIFRSFYHAAHVALVFFLYTACLKTVVFLIISEWLASKWKQLKNVFLLLPRASWWLKRRLWFFSECTSSSDIFRECLLIFKLWLRHQPSQAPSLTPFTPPPYSKPQRGGAGLVWPWSKHWPLQSLKTESFDLSGV